MVLSTLLPFTILLMLLLTVDVGNRIGKRWARKYPAETKMETGSIQAAMLGLLSLLLGFSFAGASSRFIERQDLIGREANAIGTAYRRAELLKTDDTSELKAALLTYLEHRLEMSSSVRFYLSPEDVRRTTADQDRIWAATCRGVENKPAAENLVVAAVTDSLDIHGYRVAAGRKHLPGLVLLLLVVCSVLTLGVMGYASAVGRHRNTLMISVIAILVAAALWTTIDMDWSRIGLVRVSDQALRDLHESLTTSAHP